MLLQGLRYRQAEINQIYEEKVMPKLHTMDFGGNVLISWHKKEVKLHVLGFLKSLRQSASGQKGAKKRADVLLISRVKSGVVKMLLYGLEQPTTITDDQFKACRASAVKFATAEAYRSRWQAQMKFWEAAVLEVLPHNKEFLYLPALETSAFYKKNMAQVNKGEVVYVPDDYVHFESEGESSDTIDTSIATEDTEMTIETTETVSTTHKRKQPEDATLFLHAKVLLKAEGAVVGMGEVSVLGPAISHGVQMDASSVTIEVQQVFLNIRLPFPSMGAEFLTECQGSFVRWPVTDLLLVQAPSNEIPSTSGIKAQEAVAATAETITNQASTLHNHIAEEEEENVVSSQEKHAIHVNTLELSVKEKEAVCMFLLKISNVDQMYSQLNKFMAEKNKARQRTFIGTRRTSQAQKLDLVVEYLLSKNSKLTARKQPGQAEFCVSDLFLEI